MAKEKELRLVITGDAKSAERALEGISEKSGNFGRIFKTGLAVAGAAAVGFTAGMKSCVNAAAEEERAVNMLAQAMQHHGTYTAESLEEMKAFASEQQRLTTYGDETTIAMLQQLQTFGMNTEEMKAAARAAQDLAAAKGIDLNAAAQLVGKAFAGNTSTMSRYGIVLDQTRLQAEGFTYVLEALEANFGGAAQAAADNYTGRVQQMQNAWGDLQETVGYAVLPALTDLSSTLTTVAQDLQESGTLEKMLDPLADAFGRLAPLAGDALTAIVDTIAGSDLLPAITEMFASALSAITPLLEQLGPPIAEIFGQLAGVGASLLSSLAPVIEQMAPIIGAIIESVAGFLNKAAPILQQLMAILGDIISRILAAISPYLDRILDAAFQILDAILPVLDPLLSMLNPILQILIDLLPPIMSLVTWFAELAATIAGVIGPAFEWIAEKLSWLAGVWSSIWDGIVAVFGAVWDGIKAVWNATVVPIINVIKSAWDGIASVWGGAWNAVTNAIGSALGGVKSAIGDVIGWIIKGVAEFLQFYGDLPWYVPAPWKNESKAAAGSLFAKAEEFFSWHSGGLIPGWGEYLIPLGALQGGEYVLQRSAVRSIGQENLDYMNETGRILPAGEGAHIEVHFHIPGFFGSQRELDDLARRLMSEHMPRAAFARGAA